MLKAHRFIITGLCLFAIALGCSTNEAIDDLNYPLTSINSAIQTEMTMGIQGFSENHRETYSRPFMVNQPEKTKNTYRERGRATVRLLGDSRPYTLDADIVIERAYLIKGKKPEYSEVRHDKRLARKLLMNIKNRLESRARDQNLIDDFRPF